MGSSGSLGVGEVDPKDPALQEASEGAAEFHKETRGGLGDLADAVATMNGRVSALEGLAKLWSSRKPLPLSE